jgi:hypothetical protein
VTAALAKPAGAIAAHRDAGSIAQHDREPASLLRHEAFDHREVDDVRAMDAHEIGRKHRLEIAHAESGEETAIGSVDGDVVVAPLEARHAANAHRRDAAALAHEQPFQRHRTIERGARPLETLRLARRGVGLVHRLANPLERFDEAAAAERLEQVVERPGLECRDRVPIVRRREDHRGLVRDARENLEPRQARHHDVEEDQVGLELVDRPHGVHAVADRGDESDPRNLAQQIAQPPARERLVVGDQRRDSAFNHQLHVASPAVTFKHTVIRRAIPIACRRFTEPSRRFTDFSSSDPHFARAPWQRWPLEIFLH